MIPPPPLHDDPAAPPLTDNAFVFRGKSVRFLLPVRVLDDGDSSECAVDAVVEDREVIAERWRDHPDPPPGAVQLVGTLTVRFAPAVPGHTYRAVAVTGETRRRYDGPPVERLP